MIIKVIIDKRRSNSEGKYPLKLSFANLGKTAMTSLNIWVFEYEFDKENGVLFTNDKKTKYDYQMHNSYILNEVGLANRLLHNLRMNQEDHMLPDKFKKMFLNREDEKISFNSYFSDFIKKKVLTTAKIYQSTLNKINAYYNNKEFDFSEINYSWLESFDLRMKKEEFRNSRDEIIKIGLETNARALHFRNIRSVINNAINNEVIGLELYPFRRFKIKKEKTAKRAIKVDDLRKIFNYKGSVQEEWAVNIAKLIFFLIGINAIDLYNLNKFDGKFITYNRAKTKRLYHIKTEPETIMLINLFKGSSNLLCFKDEFADYTSLGKKVNQYLLAVCEKLNIPKITIYSLRHSWATIAASLDIPKETIAASLGHGGNSVTDIYIDFNRNKIDEANRLVIDYVLEIKRKKKSKKMRNNFFI